MDYKKEDIDTIMKKTGCTSEEAVETLKAHNGDVIDAIMDIQNKKASDDQRIKELKEKIKAAIKKGNVTKIQVVRGEEIALTIPVNVGIVGMIAAPWAVIIGAIAAYGFDYDFEIVYEDGKKERI